MASWHLVFPFLVLSVVNSLASTEVPVLMWGDLQKTSIQANPLMQVTFQEFDNLLSEETKGDPFIVVFTEETLSVEDFSRRNSEGETSYPYLQSQLSDLLYLPSVSNALHVLHKMTGPEKEDHVKLTENGLSAEIDPQSGKVLFINLKDAREGESRFDLLRRHNEFMEDMFSKLKERYSKVVGIYTAHYPSWTIAESHNRVRRQAQETCSLSQPLDISVDRLRLYSKVQIKQNNIITNVTQISRSSTSFNNSELNTTLNVGDNTLVLQFVSNRGYWTFKSLTISNVNVSEDLSPNEEVYSLIGWSYLCGPTVTFSGINDTNDISVTFEHMHIQPYFSENATSQEWGESFNCVGFFTAPIWAGLMVTFILLAITFTGIMMMMDIRTMDRFDDPKGKTIAVSVATE